MKSVTVTATAIALVAMGGAGAAMADPGHGNGQGRGHDDPVVERHGRGTDDAPRVQVAPGAGVVAPCVRRRDVAVQYVFRGSVAASTPDSVTVNLVGANAHARRALARATPPVVISSAATDLLLVPTPAGTRVMRNGIAGTPLVGDVVTVKYRAPHSRTVGKRCLAGGTASVTVTGAPPLATFAGTGVVLKRVSAWGPVAP